MYMLLLYIDVAVTIRYGLIKKWINKDCCGTAAVEKKYNILVWYIISYI